MYVFELYTPTAEKALIGGGAVLIGIGILITAITVCAAVVHKHRKWMREYYTGEPREHVPMQILQHSGN